VIDGNRLDLERAGGEPLARLEQRDRHFRTGPLVGTLGFKHSGREGRGIDRNIQARPDLRQAAIVVFMRMGDDDRLELLAEALDEIHIRQNQVDARQFGPRKRHAAVNHDPFALLW
jgi:hypothetical protein